MTIAHRWTVTVVAGETAISTIAGGLSYRGYSIEDLAQHATFEETAYLILHGELPNQSELAAMKKRLGFPASTPRACCSALLSIWAFWLRLPV